MDGADVWRKKSDGEVIEAAQRLYDYTQDGERALREELSRRGLQEAPPPIATCSSCRRSIPANHPGSECLECGESFAADTLQQLLATSAGPKGINGWLLVPAVGLIVSPIVGFLGLIGALALYSDVAARGLGRVYVLELMVEIAFLVGLVVAAVRFFRKKRNAPSTLVSLYAARLMASVCLLIVEWLAGLDQFAQAQAVQVVSWALIAGIWGWYFTTSRRVKATFVN